MNNDNDIDIEKVKQKIIKIRNRKKQKQNYNYKNVPVLTSIYSESEPDSRFIPPPPELSMLYNPYNNGIFDNGLLSEEKAGEKEKAGEVIQNQNKIQNVFLSIYRYFFPVKEGATDSSPPPLDLTNLSFWQLPCDFLNTKFYDDLIDKFLKSCSDYSKDGNDTKLKSDREIIQTAFNQMLMIGLAYIMTVNVYYFVFMYKWECARPGYLPGHGMYFGIGKKEKDMNLMIDFFLRDVRKPVFYCSSIYTFLYPSLFGLLGVSRYRRVCFVFIFVFMLCFVFITMKNIGLSAFSFVSSGKINPLVVLVVLCSVFIGIFFTSQANEDAILEEALKKRDDKENPCDIKTVTNDVIRFASQQVGLKADGKPYYYSMKERDLKERDLKDPKYKIGGDGDMPEPPLGSNIDPKIFRLGQFGFAKGPVTINAIIRVIISMALLPIAQIFVSFFFLYTTSGLGLIINEGFSPLFNVMAHMNDNDGEDEKKGDVVPFYDSINKTDFFKIWVNELFISSILTIFWIVKAITVPLLVSKLNVKIVAAIVLGAFSIRSILRCGIVYRRRMCTMGEGICNSVPPRRAEDEDKYEGEDESEDEDEEKEEEKEEDKPRFKPREDKARFKSEEDEDKFVENLYKSRNPDIPPVLPTEESSTKTSQ